MIQQLSFQICPYCGKKTPVKIYCVYCGNRISDVTICHQCHSSVPINASSCPFCQHKIISSKFNGALKAFPKSAWIFTNFRSTIWVIFLLSTFTLTQLVIGSIFLFLLPADFLDDPVNYAFLSLMIMLASNTILIIIIMKGKPGSFWKKPLEMSRVQLIFLLFVILIVTVSTIEILATLIDFGLDLIGMDPSLSSPYDDFFLTPLNILMFTFLVTTIGPIFEELVFRRFTISMMLKQCQSRVLVVFTSALIFSLSHTAANLLESFRYAILHMVATFIIGIVLGIIFLRWGLRFAIIFHSIWNTFSLIVQLSIIYELSKIIDLMLVLFMVTTFIFIAYFFFKFRTSLRRIISEIILPTRTEFLLLFTNFILIITYELLLPLILLSEPQNILKSGFILFYQFCGFLIGLILINREHQISEDFKSDLQDFNSFIDDISFFK